MHLTLILSRINMNIHNYYTIPMLLCKAVFSYNRAKKAQNSRIKLSWAVIILESVKIAIKYAFIFILGGVGYGLMEIFYRGRTHFSMVLAGGICFLIIVLLDNRFGGKIPLIPLAAICSAAITAVEFVFGVIFNLWLKMGVWDYSAVPFNILGQVCLPFSLIWIAVSTGAILLNRYVLAGIFIL